MQNHGIFHSIGLSCEGSREEGFGEHLVNLYGKARRPVKLYNNGGGNPLKQVENAHDYSKFNGCENIYVMHDSDRSETGKALKLATEYGYETILACRSIEDELLRILPDVTIRQRQKAEKSVNDAKEVLAEICKLKSLDGAINWAEYFPKQLLEKSRKTSHWLDQLIRAIEG